MCLIKTRSRKGVLYDRNHKELHFLWNYFRKCCLVNCATFPDKRKSAIKFGIAISPLQVSEMPQINPRSAVAPTIAMHEYTTINGLITFSPKINSMHRAPYNPQPKMVENAKQQRAIAVNIDTQFPYVETKPLMVSSAPASTPYWMAVPLHRMVRAVKVQIKMVSVNTSKIPNSPCCTGLSVSAQACAIEPVPSPASFEKMPLAMPRFMLVKK